MSSSFSEITQLVGGEVGHQTQAGCLQSMLLISSFSQFFQQGIYNSLEDLAGD